MKASMALSLDEQWLQTMIADRDGEWTDGHCKKLASLAHRRPVKNLILPTHFMVVFEWLSKARASSLCEFVKGLQPQPPAVEAARLIAHEMDTIRILQEIMITLSPPQHNLWLVFKNLMETWSATRTDPRYFQQHKIAVIQRLRAEWNLRERMAANYLP